MSLAIEMFRRAWRGPFDGLTEQHALKLIEAVCQGGAITEDDPQHAGLWAALATIWAADWRAMSDAATRATADAERDKRLDERLAQMVATLRAGLVETIHQAEAWRAAQGDSNPAPVRIDSAEIARAVAAQVQLPRIDSGEIARDVVAQFQPVVQAQIHQHYDVIDSLKHAARETFSWFWAGIATLVCAVCVAIAVHAYVTDARQIAALRAQNGVLLQQIEAARHEPHKHKGDGR
jgi:hypothetical protein